MHSYRQGTVKKRRAEPPSGQVSQELHGACVHNVFLLNNIGCSSVWKIAPWLQSTYAASALLLCIIMIYAPPPSPRHPLSRGPKPQIGLLFMMNVCGETPSSPLPTIPSVLPSSLLTHDDGLWTMKETCSVKCVSCPVKNTVMERSVLLVLTQCLPNFLVRWTLLTSKYSWTLVPKTSDRGKQKGGKNHVYQF